MNTVIKIIDERIEIETIKERDTDFAKWIHEVRIELLEELRKEISALPSLESKIDTLQRYKPNEFPSENEVYTMEEFYNRDNSLMLKSIVGEYIRYDDLVNLLKNDIP